MSSFTETVLYRGLLQGDEAVAVVDRHGVWTWRELADRVDETVERLRLLGLPAHSRVLVMAPDSAWHQVILLACERAGLIMAPVSTRYTTAELDHALDRVRPALGLFAVDHLSLLAGPGQVGATLGPFHIVRWPETEFSVVPNLQRTPLLVTLTSGSTSAPKAVLCSSEGELAVAVAHSSMWRLNSADTVVAPLPFSWVYGLCTVHLSALVAGSKSVIVERFSPALVMDAIEQHDPTIFVGVTTHFRILLEYIESSGRRPPKGPLRMAVTGGERRNEAVFERFQDVFGVPVHDLYAATESRPGYGYDPFLDPTPVRGSCGRRISGVQSRCVSDEGETLAATVGGHLELRSAGNYMGYLDPHTLLTGEEITSSTWVAVGDLFREDEDGLGYVQDRTTGVIIRGGANVSATEVEEVLVEHPAVAQVVVFGVPDEDYGEAVTAMIVGVHNPDDPAAVSSLTEYCEARLTNFKVPSRWSFVDELPHNVNDKIDRIRSKQLYLNQPRSDEATRHCKRSIPSNEGEPHASKR